MKTPVFRQVLQEPFVHFLLLGALIYAGAGHWDAERSRYRIIVGQEQIQRLVDGFEKQYASPPNPSQLDALVDNYIREEILFREGEALDLAQQDQIVRRRVAQKFEFLQLDAGADESPTEADIERYYEQNRDRYGAPPTVALTHVYFSAGRSEDDARRRAAKALSELRSSEAARAPSIGDRFAGLYDFNALSKADLARVFGDSDLVELAFRVPPGQWVGPVRSAYGWHVVRITARDAGGPAPLSKVRDRVLADYSEQERRTRTAAAFARLRSKYTVVRSENSRA